MKRIALLGFAIVGTVVFLMAPAFAWTNPSANPTTGGGSVTAEQNSPAGVIYIKSNGNVGIGTSSPLNKLSVERERQATVSSANAAARIGGSDVYTYFGSLSNSPYATWIQAMRVSDDGVFPLVLNPSGGNIGIGTGVANPTSKLTVAGTIESTSGGFKFPDGSTQSTAFGGGTQTISAANVSSGTFGDNTGGGNYLFPANIGFKSGVSSFTIRPVSTTSMGVYDSTGAQVLLFDEGT